MDPAELAFRRGYRVQPDGRVSSPMGSYRAVNPSKDGYLRFTIRDERAKGVQVKVHRLAAYQKFGPEALHEEGIQVRHLDNNPANNADENLALGDATANAMDKAPETRLRQARDAARVLRSLSDEEVAQLRVERAGGATYKALMLKYGIAKSTVSYIVNGKTYAPVDERQTA